MAFANLRKHRDVIVSPISADEPTTVLLHHRRFDHRLQEDAQGRRQSQRTPGRVSEALAMVRHSDSDRGATQPAGRLRTDVSPRNRDWSDAGVPRVFGADPQLATSAHLDA